MGFLITVLRFAFGLLLMAGLFIAGSITVVFAILYNAGLTLKMIIQASQEPSKSF